MLLFEFIYIWGEKCDTRLDKEIFPTCFKPLKTTCILIMDSKILHIITLLLGKRKLCHCVSILKNCTCLISENWCSIDCIFKTIEVFTYCVCHGNISAKCIHVHNFICARGLREFTTYHHQRYMYTCNNFWWLRLQVPGASVMGLLWGLVMDKEVTT